MPAILIKTPLPAHPDPLAHRALRAPWPPAALLLTLMLCGLPLAAAQAQAGPAAAASQPAPAQVRVARLDSVWLRPAREAPASVLARNESKLAAETAGIVQKWTADVGAQVQRGQLLAQIDPRDAELAVQRAQAALDAAGARLQLAQSQLRRSRELVAQGFFSREALSQRETEVALAQADADASRAQLATAQRQLSKTRLHAPFAGSIKERLAQTGEAVAPGSVLFVLAETGAVEVNATLDPADVPGLRRTGELQFHSARGSHAVALLRVSPTISAPARTQLVRLAFAPGAAAPPAGTSGSLRWLEPRPHVAPDLLVRRKGVLGLFVPEGTGAAAKARFVPLPGAQEGRASALPETLGAQDRVVVRGQAALQDGQAVEVLNP